MRVCLSSFPSLARGSCIPDCEPGTYFDSELVRCGECHHSCRTCVGESIATRASVSRARQSWAGAPQGRLPSRGTEKPLGPLGLPRASQH